MNKWIRKTCIGMIVLALWLPFTAQAATTLPEPTADFYVNDFADVLDPADEALMIANGKALEALDGAQVVLVTVDFVGNRSISDYAADLFNEWGIGDAKKNNGLLIVMSIGDDDYWAVQGRGLESTLTSGMISDILYDYLEEDFAKQAYSTGAKKVYAAFVQQLGGTWTDSVAPPAATPSQESTPATGTDKAGEPAGTQAAEDDSGGANLRVFWIIVAIVLLFLTTRNRRSRRTRRGYGPFSQGHGGTFHTPPTYGPDNGWPGMNRRGWRNHSGGGGWFGGGGNIGGGGSTRGGGAGRSGGFFGGSSSNSSSRSSSGGGWFGGGGSSGGGGSTRGGGAGRSSGFFGGSSSSSSSRSSSSSSWSSSSSGSWSSSGSSRSSSSGWSGGGSSRGGGSSGGGGSTRGGGAGRRK